MHAIPIPGSTPEPPQRLESAMRDVVDAGVAAEDVAAIADWPYPADLADRHCACTYLVHWAAGWPPPPSNGPRHGGWTLGAWVDDGPGASVPVAVHDTITGLLAAAAACHAMIDQAAAAGIAPADAAEILGLPVPGRHAGWAAPMGDHRVCWLDADDHGAAGWAICRTDGGEVIAAARQAFVGLCAAAGDQP